jgi:hypothetical protein
VGVPDEPGTDRQPWSHGCRPTSYNTTLEHHLRDRLGVRFADRPDKDSSKRPVREIVGVDPALNQRWSTRRVLIKDRQGELASKFQRDHGRPPTPVEALQLAQQATLETRETKHDPTTTLDAVFHAWQTDRSQGLDPIMLAPTRELVRRLNQRAQDHRLAGAAPGRQIELADGNRASLDDLVITRRNDRRLRITATDW